MIIPERIINVMVYDGKTGEFFGDAVSMDLPEVSFRSDTVSGAGIAGEYEAPTVGHFEAMTATINWRSIATKSFKLLISDAVDLDVRSAIQTYDSGTGKRSFQQFRASLRVTPRSWSGPSLEAGSTEGGSTELNVMRYHVWLDNVSVLEADPTNYVYKVAGVDQLAPVRYALGLS